MYLFFPGLVYASDFQEGLTAIHETNYEKALEILMPLAEHGHPAAQYNIGVMHEWGNGVPKNNFSALKWYKLAANQGNNVAQFTLGTRYYRGLGVPQDYVYAHMWWNIAASNGDENGGKLRDEVAEKMYTRQINKAQELAQECVRKEYKGC